MLFAALCALVLGVGCQKPEGTGDPPKESRDEGKTASVAKSTKPAADLSASEILKRLLATYRQAKTYKDNAVVRLAFRQNGQPVFQEQPFAVAFERPDKLSITAFQATVKCDGNQLKARIEDAASNNVDNQMVVRSAPKPLKLKDLAGDELLYETISSRLRRQPVQLELLLEAGGLVAAFDADVACQRLADKEHNGRVCFRVEVPSPGGAFVFWVDQQDFLLRRLDYPAAALVSDLAHDPSVSQLELFADFRDAAINAPINPQQFVLDVPPNAKQMKAFTRPPPPLPSDLFGQQPAEFYFTRLDGKRLIEKDLAGKVVVLAWYHDDPACEATLQQVATAAQRLAKEEGVMFFAVATDPTAVSNDALTRRLAEWKVELPVVRDLEAFGDKAFHIELQPTITVLDKRGCVQIFQAGGSPELADQLVGIVERLKRGDDLAAEIVAEYRREREKYEQLLARGGPEPGELVEVPEAVIRQRSEPQKIVVNPLWECAVAAAGNLTVGSPPDGSQQSFVLSGGRSAIEIDGQGKIINRHSLEIPPQTVITFVRTAADKSGKRFFVGSSPLAPQFFLFDDRWKLLLAFPPADQAPLGVADLALTDLDNDGSLDILVAAAGGAGVVALSLQGDVRWRNGTVPAALSLAVALPDDLGSRMIFVSGDEKGAIGRINRFGNGEPPVSVRNWPIARILGGQFSAPLQANFLALATSDKNEPFAVGLSDELSEKWNYPLPLGVHQNPIEPVAASKVLSGHQGEFWIAGPDGSVHLITADGQLFDSFFTGLPLTGIAATKIGEKAVLLLSSGDRVAAWEVSVAAPPKRSRDY
ncbi:MAG TPA: hypothetical protein VGI40_03380 [Pirellulaceae bacterium]|jgi:hypothetical protein